MELSTHTLADNKATLQKFKIGDNVIVHYKPQCRVKVYGHVVGFTLNPHPLHQGELLVRISTATCSSLTGNSEQIQSFDFHHPDYSFEIL